MTSYAPSTPSIKVDLEITPAVYKLDDPETVPELSVKATLAASCSRSVTIFTWPTLLNPQLALKRSDFCCEDLSIHPPSIIDLKITPGPKRRPWSRKKGTVDEKHYVTLRPGETLDIKYPLSIVKRMDDDHRVFKCSHQPYRLSVSDSGRIIPKSIWWWGTANDVLDEEDGPSKNVSDLEGLEDIMLVTGSADFSVI